MADNIVSIAKHSIRVVIPLMAQFLKITETRLILQTDVSGIGRRLPLGHSRILIPVFFKEYCRPPSDEREGTSTTGAATHLESSALHD